MDIQKIIRDEMEACANVKCGENLAQSPKGVAYRTVEVSGLKIFYREAGPKDAPVLLLLHGFPTSSHMFRNLIPVLADTFRLIAPDYPVALLYDYRTNPSSYPDWQAYFRTFQPPTLVVWGKNDAIFPAAGAEPYKRDLQNLEFHLLDTGHFALEEDGETIAFLMRDFLSRKLLGETEDPKTLPARAFYAALSTRNGTALRDLLTEDVVWTLPGNNTVSGRVEGREGVIARGQKLAGYGIRFELKRILVSRKNFALSLHNTAHRLGAKLDQQVTIVCRLCDGRISEIESYISDL